MWCDENNTTYTRTYESVNYVYMCAYLEVPVLSALKQYLWDCCYCSNQS